ncbi:MAG: FAD-dependent oxidoreductase [Clostridiales bacterium]|nr:FAD-dependent oxidoreductase [Clostridiales bacterium]
MKIRVNIDGYEIEAQEGATILQIARENGIEIPTLCHDARVEAYGACGLCVVEVEGSPKLARACATKAADGMVIHTQGERAKQARKVALELLLSDHEGDCKAPCSLNCPAGTDCQGYVGLIANGQYREAVKLIKEKVPLPASIGRICPHPCEQACRRKLVEDPIAIAHLKSFAADLDLRSWEPYRPECAPDTHKKISIVGGGPAGLTAAYFLRTMGHSVTVYDAMPKMGGMLRYGIPQYRLPKEVLDQEIAAIAKLGVTMFNNAKVGDGLTLDGLQESSDAVLVAIGAWTSSSMRVPGESLNGVMGGIDFLRHVALNEPSGIGERVAVVGGGNTAMDACRTAVRMGAKEVYIIYRRTRDEMPADALEIAQAEEEGVTFKFLTNPVEILGAGGSVRGVRLQQMALGEPDASGRRRPVPVEGAFEDLPLDTVIMAIGQWTNPEGFEALELTKRGTIAADESTFATSLPGVFAVGDATNRGADIAIAAIGEAGKAAKVIDSFLKGAAVPYRKPYVVERTVTPEMLAEREKKARVQMPHLSPEERKTNFKEIDLGYTQELAKREASRCLECGCHDSFECKLLHYANEYEVAPARFDGEKHSRPQEQTHPFIERNADKCILCGLCVRVCDEAMGRTALGLVSRGFDTVVAPEFGRKLEKTDCISCGQCVAVCPTGALRELQPVAKSVPVAEKSTLTTCSFCSMGCPVDLRTRGDMITRALPVGESGMLCAGGRFGFGAAQEEGRLRMPMLRENGALVQVPFNEAVGCVSERMVDIISRYGNDAVAVTVSERSTCEEAFLAKRYAAEALGTENLCSFGLMESGVEEVLGVDASFNTLEELNGTDVILLIGATPALSTTMAGVRIRKAVKQGAKLMLVGPNQTWFDDFAQWRFQAEETAFLTAMLDALQNPEASGEGEAAQAAAIYRDAKKAMLVYHDAQVTHQAACLAAALTKASGHIGHARDGLIVLKSGANSQGLSLLGVKSASRIDWARIKAVISFGEMLPEDCTQNVEFLAVQDVYLTDTAGRADVVLPGSIFAETSGTYLSAQRKFGAVRKAFRPLCGFEGWQVIQALANDCMESRGMDYESPAEIFADICAHVEGFRGADRCAGCGKHPAFWPAGQSPVLTPVADEAVDASRWENAPLGATQGCANVLGQKFTIKRNSTRQ